jgi:AI-2 transport protein TqsA
MIYEKTGQENQGARFLFIAACLVAVIFGLRLARPVLLPFSLALFLSVLSLPLMLWIQKRLPAALAVLITLLLNVAGLVLMVFVASQSLSELQGRLPVYARRFRSVQESWVQALEGWGLPAREYLSMDLIDPVAMLNFATDSHQRAVALLSSAVLVLLIMYFMLSEATVFPKKLRAVFRQGSLTSGRVAKFVKEVQAYLGIKTLVSLATGVLLGFWCWFMDVDFPLLLGLVAFVLNYIPTIGSAIASIPAIFLALIQIGPGHAVIVALGYLGVNLIFGNIIEPNLMGRRLGLSTLVVMLSLLFWGWLWGPIGALLSVPLTMVVKIWLENTEDLRWMAVVLDKNPPRRVFAGDADPEAAVTPRPTASEPLPGPQPPFESADRSA